MKTLIELIIISFSLYFAGCWDIYNDASKDLDVGYNYFLAVTRTDYISVFSLNTDGTPDLSPSVTTTGTTNYFPAIHPSGNYLYVPANDSAALLVYKISNSGQLELLESETTVSFPYAVEVHPSGKYLYVSNYVNGTISMYNVNSDGTLNSIGSPVTTVSGTNPRRMDIDRSGFYLYVINGNGSSSSISIFQIGNNGLLTQITGSPVTDLLYNNDNPWNIVIHPNGKYLYVTSYMLDGDPAEVIYIFKIQTGSSPPLQYINYTTIQEDSSAHPSIAIHPDGKYLYAKSGYSSYLLAFQINADGTLNNIDSTDPDVFPSGYCDIIIHPNGKNIYILDAGGGERLDYNIFLKNDGTFNHTFTHLEYSINGSEGFALIRKKDE